MEPERMNTQAQSRTGAQSRDAGLQAHMQRIYNRMTLGVLVTALTAYAISVVPALQTLFIGNTKEAMMTAMANGQNPGYGIQYYIFMFAPLAVIWFGFNPATMPSSKLRISFFGLAVLYGISFSLIAMFVTGENIARAFFVATGMFAGLSIFGYVTKKNLDALMSFCIMGMFGVLIMSVLNMFIFKSEGMFDLISAAGIIVFSGITAWQTQAMKEMYNPAAGGEANSRMAWSAALTLYISFIALFQYILHFMNQR